jgi:hypothetical protein
MSGQENFLGKDPFLPFTYRIKFLIHAYHVSILKTSGNVMNKRIRLRALAHNVAYSAAFDFATTI